MPIEMNIYLKKMKKKKINTSLQDLQNGVVNKKEIILENTYIEEFGLQSNKLEDKNAKRIFSKKLYIK